MAEAAGPQGLLATQSFLYKQLNALRLLILVGMGR